MITLRPSNQRGGADHGWLHTRHTFSFAQYHDPKHMGFRALRVMNEDHVAPGKGFGEHPHDNMEILTYVLEGGLQHRDSLGNGEIIHAGELQLISAGTGLSHSEFNASDKAPVHFYQIWLHPAERGLAPGYQQRAFSRNGSPLRLVASPDSEKDALTIHQDVEIYLGTLKAGETLRHELKPEMHAWVQVFTGAIQLNGHAMSAGDGAAISAEKQLDVAAAHDAQIMLFDLN